MVKLSFIPELSDFLKFEGKTVKSVKGFFREQLSAVPDRNLILCETSDPIRSSVYLDLELDILELSFERVHEAFF